MILSLLAVHISEGIRTGPGELPRRSRHCRSGGLATSHGDEEIPQIALLTAAFFVASSQNFESAFALPAFIYVLNGLLGVILGYRAPWRFSPV